MFLPLWQLELPTFDCFQFFLFTLMADVLTYVPVVDVLPLTNATFYGRCYCHWGRCNSHCMVGMLWQMLMPVVDGKTTKVNYFSFISEVLNRTSSQTCGRWYLPTFLFRDGSLTLMYRASLIVLIRFRSPLPTMLKC